MIELKNLLINNWQLIVAAIIFILSFILQLLKKRNVDALTGLIMEWCLEAVELAELTSLKGTCKLEYAISFVSKKLVDTFPAIKSEQYIRFIQNTIEEILSTPQKKGGKTDAK